MIRNNHHTGLGMVRIARAPGSLSAIVGMGYLVTVVSKDGAAAGMAHLAAERMKGTSGDLYVGRMIARLITALPEVCSTPAGGIAEITGGADILRVYPEHLRHEQTGPNVALLAETLRTHGIWVGRAQTGGTQTRRVHLALPGRAIETALQPEARQGGGTPSVSPVSAAPRTSRHRPVVTVAMGCLAVGTRPERLSAVLGSCVGVALFDPSTGTGGLAHAMLPRCVDQNGRLAKYADTAVSALIDALGRAGANTNRLVAKMVGGARVLNLPSNGAWPSIGRTNVEITRQSLAAAGIDLLWEDTGGECARRMMVDLTGFDVSVRLLDKAR